MSNQATDILSTQCAASSMVAEATEDVPELIAGRHTMPQQHTSTLSSPAHSTQAHSMKSSVALDAHWQLRIFSDESNPEGVVARKHVKDKEAPPFQSHTVRVWSFAGVDAAADAASTPLRTRKAVYQPRPLVSPSPAPSRVALEAKSEQQQRSETQQQGSAEGAGMTPVLSMHNLLMQGAAATASSDDTASLLGGAATVSSSESTPELTASPSHAPSLARGIDSLGLEDWTKGTAQIGQSTPSVHTASAPGAYAQGPRQHVPVSMSVPALGQPASTQALYSGSKPVQLMKGGSLRVIQGAVPGPALGLGSTSSTGGGRAVVRLAPRRASTGTPAPRVEVTTSSPYAAIAQTTGGAEEDKHLEATLQLLARAGDAVGRMFDLSQAAQTQSKVQAPVHAAVASRPSPRATVPGLTLSSVTGVLPSPPASSMVSSFDTSRTSMGGSSSRGAGTTARSQRQSEGMTGRSDAHSDASPAPTARAVLGLSDSGYVNKSSSGRDIASEVTSVQASVVKSPGDTSTEALQRSGGSFRSQGSAKSCEAATLQRSGGSFRSQGSAKFDEAVTLQRSGGSFRSQGSANMEVPMVEGVERPSVPAQAQEQPREEQATLPQDGRTIAALTAAAFTNGSIPSLLTLLKTVTVYHADVVEQAREKRLNLLPPAIAKALTEALVVATASLRLADAEVSAIYRSKQAAQGLSADQVSLVHSSVRSASSDVVAVEAAFLQAKEYATTHGGGRKVKKVSSSGKLSSSSSSSSSSEAAAPASPVPAATPVPTTAPAQQATTEVKAGEIVDTPLGPMVMVQGPSGFMAVPLATATPLAPAVPPALAVPAATPTLTDASIEDSPSPTPVPLPVAAPLPKVPAASTLQAAGAGPLARVSSEGVDGGTRTSSGSQDAKVQSSKGTGRPQLARYGSAESASSSSSSSKPSGSLPKPVLAVSPPRAREAGRGNAKGRDSPADDSPLQKGRSRAADEADQYRSRSIPRNDSRSSLPRYAAAATSGGRRRDDSTDSRDRERDREREREMQRARDRDMERSREKERDSRASYHDTREADPRSKPYRDERRASSSRDRPRDTRESASNRRSSTNREADVAAREREYRRRRDSREHVGGGRGGGGARPDAASSRAPSDMDEDGVTECDSASQRAYKLAQEEKERERAQRKAAELKQPSFYIAPSAAAPYQQQQQGVQAGYYQQQGQQYGIRGGYGVQPSMAVAPSFSMGTGIPIAPPPLLTRPGPGQASMQQPMEEYSYDPSAQGTQMSNRMMQQAAMQQQQQQQQQQYNSLQRAQSSSMLAKAQSFSMPRTMSAGGGGGGLMAAAGGGGAKIASIFQAVKAVGALSAPRPGMQRVQSLGTMSTGNASMGRATTQALGPGPVQGRSAQDIAAKMKADKSKDRMSVLMEDDDTVLMG